MKINLRDEAGVSIVAVSGEPDASSAADLEKAIDRLLAEGRRSVLVSLGEVGFIDSAGLAALVKALKRVRKASGKLFLAGLQPAVRRVFELTRLDKAFEIAADEAEAKRQFAG